ncbi:MAG: YqgE/AlgH family protein [Verrucomicrobia bacterium]|nr:YqgE/AlgH family protein [Verrucomicrobiota bacterium]
MAKSTKSLKGQLLLDGGKLAGSFFHRAVVLVCEHNAEGAFGLVLNRATGKKVGDALTADLRDQLKHADLFLGGPVQSTALSYLHADQFLPDANVLPNLALGHSLDELVDLGENFSATQQVKIFAGYAGWSAGQLDEEMKRGSWLTHAAKLEHVFDPQPATLWRRIVRRKGWEYKLLSDGPEDISCN